MSNKRYLYQLQEYFGRMGEVEGLFVATEEEIRSIMGQDASFGEILGKHSYVEFEITEHNVTKVDIDSESVEKVALHLGDTWSGYNPLDYVSFYCEKCEDSYRREDAKVISSQEFDMELCEYCYKDMKSGGTDD